MKRFAAAKAYVMRKHWSWRHRQALRGPAPNETPRLLADVSAIIRHDAQTGIQRVVRAIWSELLLRHDDGFQLVPVFASASHGYCYAPRDFLDDRRTVAATSPVRGGPSDVFLGLDLSAQFLPRYRHQLRGWRSAGTSINLIVYDILPVQHPQWFNPSTVINFKRWFDVLGADVDRAFCISRQVGGELAQAFARMSLTTPPAIDYVGMGGDIAASRPTTGLCEGISQILDRSRFRPAIMMVGTIEPRKGYDVALDAFEHLWATHGRNAPDLVIVGKPGWRTDAFQARLRTHPEVGQRLHWLDRVSDEALCRLYENSRGLLMASHAEGFGLPLLEAVTHCQHVVARDLPVFRELGLPQVTYFQSDAPTDLAATLMDLVKRGESRPPAPDGLPTWRQSVDGLLVALGLVKTDRAASGRSRVSQS